MKIALKRLVTWFEGPARAVHIYLLAAATGVATFLVVYGAKHLLGTNEYWEVPQQDERMALMGYRYFLADTWHWPVFLNHAVNVPYSKSVAFLDCIPIWALLNKAIATLAPTWATFSAKAYLGLWHCLVYALQPVFGVACLRALRHRSWRAGIVTTGFFIAVPTWIFRYGHPALSAHWILLWALYLYLRTPPGTASPRVLNIAKLSQLVMASLVTPYHAAISFTVFAPSLFRSRHRRTILSWLPLGILCTGLATWFAGYFAAETMRAQWGFQWESANLLGWLIPQRSGILGDAQWIASVNATPWQYEGYAYLGLGVLGLLAMFTPHVKDLQPVLARHRVLFVVVVGSAVFALSNHVFFGSHELMSFSIPRFLRWTSHQFRSPGRFVWLPTYVLIVFVLHWALTRFSNGRRFAIIAAALAIQVLDATGDWSFQRATTSGPHAPILDLTGWRPLVHAHRAVSIIPPYPCVTGEDGPKQDHASMEIQFLASERALPINGTYSAREMRMCAAEEHEWPILELRRDTLYVLLPQALAIAERFEAHGAHCGMFDHGRVCSTNEQAISEAIRTSTLRPSRAPLSLGYGQKLALAESAMVEAGWTGAELGGRWTWSSVASVLLHLEGDPPARPAVKLQVQARLCGARQVQDVDIFLDETILATLHFDEASNDGAQVRTIAIPDREYLRHRAITIQFVPHDIQSPKKLGCDADQRPLGIWVSQLWFE